jgi:hypothetical protein
MPRYKVQQDYRSGLGAFSKGDRVELDSTYAAQINKDSPGTLEYVSGDEHGTGPIPTSDGLRGPVDGSDRMDGIPQSEKEAAERSFPEVPAHLPEADDQFRPSQRTPNSAKTGTMDEPADRADEHVVDPETGEVNEELAEEAGVEGADEKKDGDKGSGDKGSGDKGSGGEGGTRVQTSGQNRQVTSASTRTTPKKTTNFGPIDHTVFHAVFN